MEQRAVVVAVGGGCDAAGGCPGGAVVDTDVAVELQVDRAVGAETAVGRGAVVVGTGGAVAGTGAWVRGCDGVAGSDASAAGSCPADAIDEQESQVAN